MPYQLSTLRDAYSGKRFYTLVDDDHLCAVDPADVLDQVAKDLWSRFVVVTISDGVYEASVRMGRHSHTVSADDEGGLFEGFKQYLLEVVTSDMKPEPTTGHDFIDILSESRPVFRPITGSEEAGYCSLTDAEKPDPVLV
jgi:hypothetical protein